MATKQEIVDRCCALHDSGVEAARAERKAYDARVRAEMGSLQELCGSTGHVFTSAGGMRSILLPDLRECVFCRAPEKN